MTNPFLARFAGFLIAAALAAFSWPAEAQRAANCADREEVVEFLAAYFGERPVAAGIALNGGLLVELFVSFPGRESAGNTFTLLATNPASSVACMILGGSSWTSVSLPLRYIDREGDENE